MMDVPLRSAVLVAHDPHGARPILDGASLSGDLAHQLDYNSRVGEYAEKGGCEREATADDERSVQLDLGLAAQLDYVSRTGAFESKGANKQIDCTFFGQTGPVSREALEAALAIAGADGAGFMKSILTVDRRYAPQLGLDTKEAFEELLRTTWARAVCEWGITSDPSQVRWVANYHTDAENSLHVHITTWLTRSGGARPLEPGWKVPAAQTRAAKELIYQRAYRPLLLQLDKEKDLYRDLARAQARAELGITQDPEMLRRIASKARALGESALVSRTLDEPDSIRLRTKLDELAKSWDFHKGSGHSISSDRWMMSAARDVLKDLEEHAPGYAEVVARWRENCEQRADAHGLAVVPPSPDGDVENTNLVTQHERDSYLRPMIDDLRARTATMIAGDIRDGLHPARLEHQVARAVANVAYDDLRAAARAGADAGAAVKAIAASPLVREALREAVGAKVDAYAAFGIGMLQATERALPLIERKLSERFSCEVAAAAKDPSRVERALSRDAVQRVLRGDYAHLGLSKSGIESLREDLVAGRVERAARRVQDSPGFKAAASNLESASTPKERVVIRKKLVDAMEASQTAGVADMTVGAVVAAVMSVRASEQSTRKVEEERPRTEEARRVRDQRYADYTRR